ncbi:MAG TPA: SPOR domain-containing protein, partial [Devosia sp.]|nr:SPOR domain-containing protein [Devosia sp.]
PDLELRPSLERANHQAAAPSENDRFTVPPVFGVGTPRAPVAQPAAPASHVPAPPQRPVSQEARFVPQQPVQRPSEPMAASDDDFGRDPIDEIESLIGSAMRVELDAPQERAPAPAPTPKREPSPALRSLATPTLATPKPSTPRNLSSVDEAVFAAAQASGAEIDWVHAPEATSKPEPVARVRRRAPRVGMSRAVAGPLVALLLLGAAGGGLYWALGINGEDGPAPLLTADATPIKETPEAQPESPNSQSIIFNEMDGVTPGENEQLVSRDQTNLSEMANIPTPDVSEEGLANRKVRTVTVRPDGTIVSSAEGVAGSSILPVDRPNVPVVPGATDGISELLANVEATTPTATLTPPTPTVAPTATPAAAPEVALTPARPGSVVPAVDAAGNPIPGKTAIVPRIKPATFPPQTIAAAPAPTAPTVAAPTQAAGGIPGATEVAALPNNAPAYVQLASQRSEADARQTAQALVARFGPLFGGASMEVQRVDLGERGIYFRVRVPASSLQEANTLCNNIK